MGPAARGADRVAASADTRTSAATAGGACAAAAGVSVRGLSWTPLGRRTPVLAGIDLQLAPGERVLLTGPSGAGKSTLLRALAGVLTSVETGTLAGSVQVDGHELGPAGNGQPAPVGRVGLMVQDPADARVAGLVGRDVAFGPESAGLPRPEIHRRVAEALDLVGFPYPPDHPVSALSGGQAQRLALAGVLALRPGLLLLDEPTAMLDRRSAAQLRAAVCSAVADRGTTLIVVEHQLEGWLDALDRLVVLGPDGTVSADGPLRSVLAREGAGLADRHGVWVPGQPDPVPLPLPVELLRGLAEPPRERPDPGIPLLSAHRVGLCRRPAVGLRRGRGRTAPAREVLHQVELTLQAGQLHAVHGPSGAGKSSLLSVLAGLEPPTTGQVLAHQQLSRGLSPTPHAWTSAALAERLGWVPQRAEAAAVGSTVAQSVLATARALGLPADRSRTVAAELLEAVGLGGRSGQNPHRLSSGEQRRLALVSAVLHGPDLLALDEPTVGQDRHTWSAVTGVMAAARSAGTAVVTASHDDRLVQRADQRTELSDGWVIR